MLSARRSLWHGCSLRIIVTGGFFSVLMISGPLLFCAKQIVRLVPFFSSLVSIETEFQCVKHERIYVFARWQNSFCLEQWPTPSERYETTNKQIQTTDRIYFWLDSEHVMVTRTNEHSHTHCHTHTHSRSGKKSNTNRHFHRFCFEMLVVGMR